MLRFGEIVDVKNEPGIYFKAPFAFFDADNVQIDRRPRAALRSRQHPRPGFGRQVLRGRRLRRLPHLGSARVPRRRVRSDRNWPSRGCGPVSMRRLRRVYGLRGFEAALSEERAVDDARSARPAAARRHLARPADRGCAHPPDRPDGRGFAADLRPHEGRTSGRSRAAAGARPRGGAAHHAPAPTAKWWKSSPRRARNWKSCAARAKPSAMRPSPTPTSAIRRSSTSTGR